MPVCGVIDKSKACKTEGSWVMGVDIAPHMKVIVWVCNPHKDRIEHDRNMQTPAYHAGYKRGLTGEVPFRGLQENAVYMDGYTIGEAERKDIEGSGDRMDNVRESRGSTVGTGSVPGTRSS
jgi:hypothetical protein